MAAWATRAFGFGTVWSPASGAIAGNFVRVRNDYDLAYTYGQNASLRSPIECIAEDVADAARTLRLVRIRYDRGGNETRTPVRNHAILRLLRKPHPALTWSMFVELCMEFYDLTGKAPIRMEDFDAIGRPGKLTPFPPHLILDLPKRNNGWRFQLLWDEGPVWVPASDVLYWYDPDLLNPYGDGCGRARAVDDEVSQDQAMARFNTGFFEAQAFLGAIINVPGASDAALDDLEKKFAQKRAGLRNAHKSFLTNAEQPVTATNLTPKLRELNFQDSREQSREFIAQVFQTTRERRGITEGASVGAMEGSDFHQQSKNVKPRLGKFIDFLNCFLLPLFDLSANLELECENPVRESAEQRRKNGEIGGRLGALTIDEVRECLGRSPLPDGAGNVLTVPVNNVVVVPAEGDIAAHVAEAVKNLNTHIKGAGSDAPPPTDDTKDEAA